MLIELLKREALSNYTNENCGGCWNILNSLICCISFMKSALVIKVVYQVIYDSIHFLGTVKDACICVIVFFLLAQGGFSIQDNFHNMGHLLSF